ncbi:hypothetical protein JET18_11325 [Chryseobacterium sp. L7]|uniref:Uncharacterized protein n=1 Tax=Chryseobacterium endalhagicum TaxID=2797638 RepID=A0ABS1QFR5_9FLAO|nr:hypothetical protein [Chryseobacterium endalhagicum]MBL1221436.1 hypothetical protein [Chryseobacterium endalhagicum]
MKRVSAFYCIALAVLNLVMDSINARFTFFDIFFVILAGLPLLVNKKWLYQLFGGILSLMSLYVLLAVFLSHIRDVQQIQLQPLWTYGMGYVLGFITLCSGLMMAGLINSKIKKIAV